MATTAHDDNDPTGQLGRELAHVARAAAVGISGGARPRAERSAQRDRRTAATVPFARARWAADSVALAHRQDL